MRLLLLGATGVIGKNLQKYICRTNYSLICTAGRLCSADNINQLQQLFRDYKPNIVISALGKRREKVIAKTQELPYSSYIQSIKNIASCINTFSLQKLLFLSTHSVLDTRFNPSQYLVDYSASRQWAENYLLSNISSDILSIVRPTIVYGSFDIKDRLRPLSLLDDCLRGRRVFIYGDGREVRNYIHIDDLCRIIMRNILSVSSDGASIVNASHENISYAKLFSLVESFCSKRLVVINKNRTMPYLSLPVEATYYPEFYKNNLEQWLSTKAYRFLCKNSLSSL